jgi:hypothetical protein
LLNSIIEHISPERIEFLFASLTKASGSVFIVVPNFYSPRRLLRGREREWEHERQVTGHVNFLSKQDIVALLRRHGFGRIRFSFFHMFRGIGDLNYRLFGGSKLLYKLYFLFTLYPFYYLRDSFWVFAQKPGVCRKGRDVV